mgnify:CR=1 FL=1
MCEKLIFEGKTKEEAIDKCKKELKTTEDNIIIVNQEEKNVLFKGKKVSLQIILKNEIIKYIKNFFNDLSKNMNIDIAVEINENNNVININLISSNNAILIGKDGKNLDAIQTILRTIVSKNARNFLKINVDVSNYKTKKMEKLQSEIIKLATEIQNTKIDVKLDPMNSYERMIVHNVISKYSNLKTESIGEEPDRYIVIKYREDWFFVK